QGLPAMYRGKQVVIAGDSKQLKPNDLYQARWEDESEDIADLEIDSLLDLSTKYLPSVRLTGHYRSRNLDLIDFSNRHFYDQSLELIPYFSELNKLEPSIKYIAVQGLWENNTNPDEAKSVVNLVIELLKKGDGKSIGIVTFNFKQAQLITDLLEERTAAQKILIPESLFVKNIENVQGDEKDIIVFSIGYAPDSRGKFNMKFGSLNQEGGANRLNVAVTRAKDKIYLVASIFPQQLLVEDSTHEGPKLLKKYLEYAWQVSEGLYKPSPVVLNRESRDWYLSKKILESKINSTLKYSEELPFADVTVKNAEKYYALILTDDDLYFNARNSKEPHAYKQTELKEKGWMCMRFFSREYWLQKNTSLPIISPDL
ncbi:MAG TPA: DEAD/DEAH box helicase, partial [Cytophagaceae bacterium]|nr:DEAD/DEAH box helicase [Cytophagaceae bacterium]